MNSAWKARDVVSIKWSGGNGPHLYRIESGERGDLYVAGPDGCFVEWVDSLEFRLAEKHRTSEHEE